MHLVGMNPVVVHGGGPQISDLMRRLGKEPEFLDGLRVTDAETVDIARMVLVGKVNREIVAAVNVTARSPSGSRARTPGSSGRAARPAPRASSATSTRDRPVDPRAAPPRGPDPGRRDDRGRRAGQAYNINADTVAGAIAEALGAEKLVYLTDVAGVYERLRRRGLA